MEGQQVFVTGADGEQMVLSGPEAAALLAQAGISLGDQDQAAEDQTGEQQIGATDAAVPAAPEAEGGNILVPEGSSVAEDGSIIAADGSILAPAGTVIIGEDGTLMMSENSALLSDTNTAAEAAAGGGAAGTVFTTPDGNTFKAGEGDILTDAEGNFLTDEDGNILTTAHLGALGATTSTGVSLTSTAPTMATSDMNMIPDGAGFLRTAEGNLLTDEEGNFIAADGNIIKAEEAHKILASQEAGLVNTGEVSDSTGATPSEINEVQEEAKSDVAPPSEPMLTEKAPAQADIDMDEPPQMEVRSKTPPGPPVDVKVKDPQTNAVLEPEKPKSEVVQELLETPAPIPSIDIAAPEAALPDTKQEDGLQNMPILETEDPEAATSIQAQVSTDAAAAVISEDAGAVLAASADTAAVSMQEAENILQSAVTLADVASAAAVSTVSEILSTTDTPQFTTAGAGDIVAEAGEAVAQVAVSIPSSSFVTTSLPVELSLPSSADGGIYTTADGRVLSLPEGIVTNTAGHLINPADGSILTTEDGTPLMLPEGAVLQAAGGGAVGVASTTSGIIMASSGSDQVVASVMAPVPSVQPSSVTSTVTPQLSFTQSSTDGTMIAPEGSMIASDGSILAADGTMLAPPGSVSLTPEPVASLPAPATNPPIPASLAPTQPLPSQPQQPQNLIGLQLPESGEVLYLDPNDPAAQQLLQEAGIHLGDGGVLQTLDGQVLAGEDGTPITTNTGKAAASPSKHNNIVSGALAAAGLVDTSDIDIPLSHGVVTDIRPNLPTQPVSYNQLTAGNDDAIRQHLSQLQPRYTPPAQPQKAQKTQYKKLTFNSGAPGSSYSSPAPAPIPKRSIAPKTRRTVPNTDLQIGPDQQKVTYTVTSENGYTQTYMMICSKSLDQNTLINTLIKNISSDPNHKGKKTIKITQHKYGAKKTTKQQPQRAYNGPTGGRGAGRQRLAPAQQRVVQQQVAYKPAQAATASPASVKQQSPMKPPQQLLEADQDIGDFSNNLSLDDIMKQVVDTQPPVAGTATGTSGEEKEPKVLVKCNYCTNFKCVLNSQTWENILNHILPVAKEELHCSFYGNILKHFARGLRVAVTGGREQCEVVVTHGLVCRRTGTWFSVDKPGVELATSLATHIAAVQPGVSGPYGARPRGNSLICLFCSSPYTPEDYQRHLKPHEDFIKPVLLLAAGAYCATSFELDIKKASLDQDLRFLPCTKFAADFNCSKRLQATVDCFRENFDSRGFLQVSNSAMTKCSVCRTPTNTYCALFKPSAATARIFGGNSEEMLSVCANCQKQFVNVVMRENSFEKQLKMFQLHHMEQLCGMLRVLLSASQAVCSRSYNLLYSVQEGGSLYSASNTLHTVAPAKIVMNPLSKVSRLEEDRSQECSGPSLRYCCDQCKFSIDLTRLQHAGDRNSHLVDMAVGVVLEHVVPHTESLMAVIMTAAFNEVFNLKFEFTASVEGEGANKKIIIGLDRKIVALDTNTEVTIQKDVQKTIELLKSKLKQDKKGNVTIKKRHLFMDTSVTDNEAGQLMEVGKFLDSASNVLQLYGSCGCNTKLLDFYKECALCGKFSFPDFRLTAAIKTKDGVALCENCCETILSLCVPSEPEKVAGRGDTCLLLGQERNTGHRLVLSNNTKKWISAEGVEKIQAVSAVASNCQLPDYSTQLVQLLKSHLQAVAERAWSDSSCMTARAGFCVTQPDPSKQFPIEVKVTIRPPKAATPPPKLVITPVNVKQAASPAGSATRLVKITANRRIIPVRDPTSISTPPRGGQDKESPNKKQPVTKATKTTAKVTPKLPPHTSITASALKPDPKEEEIDSDLEKEDDFESIDAIANFISSSEPPVKKVKSEEAASNEVCDVLMDEFTDNSLSTPKAVSQNNGTDKTPESLSKLPKNTVVTSNSSLATPEPQKGDENLASTATSNLNNGELGPESHDNDGKDFNLPPGLVISPANAQLNSVKASGDAKVVELGSRSRDTDSPKVDGDNVIELGSPKTELVPSPASDATTSTKDTVTPSKAALVTSKPRGRPPGSTNKIPKDGIKSSTSTPTTNNRQSNRETDNGVDSLTSLDVDLENEDLDDEENNEIGVKKSGVKLSAILPKPVKSRNSTPASSSKKGMPSESGSRRGRPPGSTNKRKLSDDPSALKLSKKAKLSEDDEDSPATPEQGVPVLEPSSSGRVRKARKMFDL